MKKSLLTLALLIGIGAAAVAWRAHARLTSARATLAALDARRTTLDTGMARLRATVVADRQRAAEIAAQPRHAPATAVVANAAPSATASAKPDTAQSLDRYPGLRALFRRSVAGKLALRYGAFYRTAKLTPEQVRRFENVMTEADETRMDFELAARSQGVPPSDPGLAPLRAEADAKLRAALTDALGPAGYDQYRQYRRLEPITGTIGDVTTLAVQHDVPFTAEQADRLMLSIAAASPNYQAGGKVDPLTVDWGQVLVDTQPYLAPQQFALVRQEGDMQQVYALLKQFYAQRNAASPPRRPSD